MGFFDRNTEQVPEGTSVEQELKRARAFGWRDIIICLAIVGVFLLSKDWLSENFGFTFGDSYDGLAPVLEETQFGIKGLDGEAHTFVYVDSDITLHEGLKDYLNTQKGEIVEAQETRKVDSGVYHNDAYGDYQLHVQTKLDKYIVVKNADGVIVFNLESNDTTQELYNYMMQLRDEQLAKAA